MTSGLLYLAIVGVWAVVLVPMWVRRSDTSDPREGDPADARPAPWGQGRARARVVARRRRRLAGIAAFFVVTVVFAAAGVAPWWVVPVPGLALVGFLACLRAAADYDAELAERDRLRAEESAEEYEPGREPAGEYEPASQDPRVIDFPTGSVRASRRAGARDELFDQYAEPPRRAAGEG